jgi:glycosyltransferase involved in cell wall biosynthesis
MKISLCVTAYERPEFLVRLIRSFESQDHDDRELCICDDSPSDAVLEAVRPWLSDSKILYRRNPRTLGFARNLRESVRMATGDAIVILGDDDLLARRDALARYSDAFTAYPDADFIHANIVQLDPSARPTLLYPYYREDTWFPPGLSALQGIWLQSIHITGMALRRSARLDERYPDEICLFPQVQLVGRLLLDRGGVGLASFLCAATAHPQQLGFRAIAGEGVLGPEQHGTIEVHDMAVELAQTRPAELAPLLSSIDRQLARRFTTNLPNEKINCGNVAVTNNLVGLIGRNRFARRSPALWLVYLLSMVAPRRALRLAKNATRALVVSRQFRRYGADPESMLPVFEPGARQLAPAGSDQP